MLLFSGLSIFDYRTGIVRVSLLLAPARPPARPGPPVPRRSGDPSRRIPAGHWSDPGWLGRCGGDTRPQSAWEAPTRVFASVCPEGQPRTLKWSNKAPRGFRADAKRSQGELISVQGKGFLSMVWGEGLNVLQDCPRMAPKAPKIAK